jgi:hypothetical protein
MAWRRVSFTEQVRQRLIVPEVLNPALGIDPSCHWSWDRCLARSANPGTVWIGDSSSLVRRDGCAIRNVEPCFLRTGINMRIPPAAVHAHGCRPKIFHFGGISRCPNLLELIHIWLWVLPDWRSDCCVDAGSITLSITGLADVLVSRRAYCMHGRTPGG